MTDPLSLAVAGTAAVVALAAGWFSVPAPPDLDGERWFKLVLATLLRGRVEGEGGEAATWEQTVLRFVPYHPAGRFPERKIDDPAHYRPPGLSLPGELGLVGALARLDDREARWRRMYEGDESALDALLQDPAALGDDYDPARLLGEGGTWDDLADWGAGDSTGFADALHRRMPATWVLLGEGPVLDALAADIPETVRTLDDLGDLGNVVIAATGDAVNPALRALIDAPGLRDRLVAFVSIGGVVRGEHADWMARWFSPDELDTEKNRATPYMSVAWVDRGVEPTGTATLAVADARFPDRETGALSSIEVIDLGILFDGLPAEIAARGLRAVATLWVLAKQ